MTCQVQNLLHCHVVAMVKLKTVSARPIRCCSTFCCCSWVSQCNLSFPSSCDQAEHLAHWGINMVGMQKTEKTMAELQIDLNMSFEFDKITESGVALESPVIVR